MPNKNTEVAAYTSLVKTMYDSKKISKNSVYLIFINKSIEIISKYKSAYKYRRIALSKVPYKLKELPSQLYHILKRRNFNSNY